jgi:hypothetical protein
MPPQQPPLDRLVGVVVSSDKMTAVMALAARASGKDKVPAVAEIVERVLAQAQALGITAPIERSVLGSAVSVWRTRGEKRDVVIARGHPPVPGADAEITLRRPRISEPTGKLAADRVGKRNQGRVLNVEKGAVLATVTRPAAGKPGRAVTGESVAAPSGKPATIEAGALVSVEESDAGITYRALESAIVVELSTRRIEVARSIEIPGTVDHETGNLDVWGSVTIRGSVVDGFSVRARGDVIIAGSAESAFIESGGHVTVGGGILGKSGITVVRCRGDCTARFVENAAVDAGGDLHVGDFVLHSRISAGGTVEVKGRGAVLASQIAAGRAVLAATLGSDARLPVEILVGGRPQEWRTLARMERDMRFLRRDTLASTSRSPRAESAHQKDRGDRRAARRRAAAVNESTLRRRRRALIDQLMEESGPRVLIRREVFPRTRIRLGPYTLDVESALRAGVFRIDDEQGAAVWLPDHAGDKDRRS